MTNTPHLTRRTAIIASVAAVACAPRPDRAEARPMRPVAMLSPRATHVAINANGRILMLGGFAREGTGLTLVERFDPAAGAFERFGALETPRIQPLAHALADGRVLVIGGEWRAGVSTAETLMADGESAPLGTMRGERAAAASEQLVDGRILICGGEANRRMNRTAEIFDPTTNRFERVGDMKSARAGHTATRLPGGKVLIVGGGTEAGAIADAEIFDPARDQFEALPPAGQARFKHGAVALANGDVLIVGGSDAQGGETRGRLGGTEIFDPRAGVFRAGPPLADPRYKLQPSTIALAGGSVLVASGGSRPEILRPGAAAFEPMAVAYDQRRDYMAAVALDERRALVTGGYDATIATTDRAWIVES
jgi:hypothetical protein